MSWIIAHKLIPFASIFIEPAKVLFLNNAINHGILSPIGITQAAKAGKSILFILEPNPGPGVGVLLAYTFFGTGTAKITAPGVAIIHAFGGIHEPYFPFILMKPQMIIASICGAVSGNFVFEFFNCGLVATASPGSYFSVLAVAPKSDYLPIIAGMLLSTAVSFAVGSIILKLSKGGDDYDNALEKKLLATGDNKIDSSNGFDSLLDILTKVDGKTEKNIIKFLEDKNNILAERLKANMITFEDIENIDDMSIQKILKEVNIKDVAIALKGADDNISSIILKNQSSRAAQALREEISLLGALKVSQVEEAKRNIVKIIRRLEQEGVISINKGSEDDILV